MAILDSAVRERPKPKTGVKIMSKFASQQDYENIDAVRNEYPGAAEIVEVDGGWRVFDTVTDAETWKTQK